MTVVILLASLVFAAGAVNANKAVITFTGQALPFIGIHIRTVFAGIWYERRGIAIKDKGGRPPDRDPQRSLPGGLTRMPQGTSPLVDALGMPRSPIADLIAHKVRSQRRRVYGKAEQVTVVHVKRVARKLGHGVLMVKALSKVPMREAIHPVLKNPQLCSNQVIFTHVGNAGNRRVT